MYTLEMAKRATVQLQKENLIPGNFYKMWFVCKSEISQIRCPLAHNLLKATNARKRAF